MFGEFATTVAFICHEMSCNWLLICCIIWVVQLILNSINVFGILLILMKSSFCQCWTFLTWLVYKCPGQNQQWEPHVLNRGWWACPSSWSHTSRRSCPLPLLPKLRRRKWKQRRKNLRSPMLTRTLVFFIKCFVNMANKKMNLFFKKGIKEFRICFKLNY